MLAVRGMNTPSLLVPVRRIHLKYTVDILTKLQFVNAAYMRRTSGMRAGKEGAKLQELLWALLCIIVYTNVEARLNAQKRSQLRSQDVSEAQDLSRHAVDSQVTLIQLE